MERTFLQFSEQTLHYAQQVLVASYALRVPPMSHVIASLAIVMQQKTQRPVQFEITEQTRDALAAWIRASPTYGTFLLSDSAHRAATI